MSDESISILLVEDEAAHVELVRRAFEARGDAVRLVVARSLGDARRYLGAQAVPPALIIADWRLPDGEGIEFLTAPPAHTRAPVVIMTSHGNERAAVEAMKAGALDYVVKSEETLLDLPHVAERALHESRARSEQARMEHALRQSEEKYRHLVEDMPALVCRFLADGTLTFVNQHYCEYFKVPREALEGRNFFMFIPEVERESVRNRYGSLTPARPVITYEHQVMGPDGTLRWQRWTDRALFDEQGRSVEYQSIGEDITERKLREREMETITALSANLRAARTRAEMMIIILDHLKMVLRADGAALASPDPVTGETVFARAIGKWETLTGVRLAPGAGISSLVLTSGRPYRNDDIQSDPRLVRLGQLGNLRAAACVPLIAEDQTLGVLWIGRERAEDDRPSPAIGDNDLRLLTAIGDIAAIALYRAGLMETLEERVANRTRELAEANQRLKELDRLKTKFVTDVSHELRTPVTNLSLYLNLLERGKSEKRESYLAVLKEQAARLASLVEDILDLSRLERDMAQTTFSPVDLNEIAGQVVAAHQAQAERAGLALTFEPASNLPLARGEPQQLAQVITNLVTNSLSYTPAGSVRVRTYLDPRRRTACLEVRDSGIGIEPEDLPHIFERFYRGRRAGQSDIPGAGLGLGVVKEIVELHGGTIDAQSHVGEGSTFRVWLPLSQS
jgi:PAS domain S-box-containing protein